MSDLGERPAAPTEAAAVAALIAATWPDTFPEARVLTAWSSPQFSLERDTRVAVASSGELVGYAEVQDLEGGHTRFGVLLAGSAVDQLADWAEARVAAASVPPARIVCYVWTSDLELKRLLESRDFRLVRHFFRMGIELDPDIVLVRPCWPGSVTVRNLRQGEERSVYELHQETFEGLEEHVRMSYDEWAHSLLGGDTFDPNLWWLGEAEGVLVGFIGCERDDRDPETGWGLLLGVRRPWRRSGLGLSLVRHAIAEMGKLGMRRVLGGVDGDNRARRLYERAGMRVVHQFDIYEKSAPRANARAACRDKTMSAIYEAVIASPPHASWTITPTHCAASSSRLRRTNSRGERR